MCAIKQQQWGGLWACCVGGLVWLMSTAALANTEPSTSAQTQHLLELIRAEQNQLQAKLPNPTAVDPKKEAESTSQAAVILHAMYGVGKRVVAEVSINGQPYLYVRGQRWPMGDYQGRSGVRLVSMDTRCVQLAQGEQLFDACVWPQEGRR